MTEKEVKRQTKKFLHNKLIKRIALRLIDFNGDESFLIANRYFMRKMML